MAGANGLRDSNKKPPGEHVREVEALTRMVTYARQLAHDLGLKEPAYWLDVSVRALAEELDDTRRVVSLAGEGPEKTGRASVN